ncbi:MAG TPA: hypothetical protein DD438_05385 [Verrucomicrobiales bacterium]|nr:hypothetical protein [Roseibacillus sp.]HBM77522.1 hypothetical protein [Verrucomicrobiales bacterium]HCQ38493.1 hypothetical protein [Verrucomicrobiales bacterium]
MKNQLIRIALLLAFSGVALSQVYTPPAPETNPNRTPTDTSTTVNRQQPDSQSPFGEEIPLLNPGDETITVAGITIPLGDNRIMRSRFEKYLSQPEENSEDAQTYRGNIDRILGDLSPYRKGGPDIKTAYQTLPAASAFPADARICMTLAEAVYVAMLAKRDNRSLQKLNMALEEEKQKRIRDGDWKTRTDRDQKTGEVKSTNEGGDKGGNKQTTEATSTGRGAQSLEYAEILRRIGEVEAMKKKNLAQSEVQELRSKIQYQANMALWTMQRRYQHVLMASRFYNQIWKDGDSTLHIDKNSDVSKMFSESLGVNPTVSTLDSVANEAIQEVNKAVEAVNFLLERDELHTAQKRLLEAFFIGEYLAPVATLELEKKRRIQLYVRSLFELYDAMQAKNYTQAKELVASLKETAKDFPSAKAESAITGYTFASNMAIQGAKAALLEGDKDKVKEEIQTAAEIWPTNPKLEEFSDLLDKSGALVVARNDFERLLREQNFREIFKRQYEFGAAVKGNATNEDAFKTVIENIIDIEKAIGMAREADKRGNSFAAYEALAEKRSQQEYSKDPKLGEEIETIIPKVSSFVDALQRAKNFEDSRRDQTGSAMAWYLKALKIYPASEMAEEGFQRLLDKVLPDNDLLPPSVRSEAVN